MFTRNLLAPLLLALSITANPVQVNKSPVTVSISRRVNLTSVHNLVRHDQARARVLKAKGAAMAAGLSFQNTAIINEPVNNQATTYIAKIDIGNPPTSYFLIVDTGSSNTWIGAGTSYNKTTTSTETTNSVTVSYGSGSFAGTEFTDQVAITPGLVIPNQSIGVASRSNGFIGLDGILGIGPVDLTRGTLSPATDTQIPTVTDNLFAKGVISNNKIGVYFEPSNTTESENGEITWGGTDSTKFTGSITYIPLTRASPANEYWGINQSVRYGTTAILSTTAGIVDTGTTLILLATDGFKKYQSATGGVDDQVTGLLRVTPAQFKNLKSLFFTSGGATFELTANAQIWPRALNTDIGGTGGNIYLIVASLGSTSGEGLDFINGFAFLERFYSVLDTENKRVGFATTHYTYATFN
ncbi:hypothetical protein GALMADRAFT_135505 [Galerina marginata CBS 339.88]|uniref:Peptidase A1 domain-containing protein n=1 Tax=Galerina marginata (strain CBS 339.88) TaxID=685588 RepID=A0A067TIG5_GALM3|nr:hypothetical protein GALMADRAFT_135505 [Galerina marginata CBS 339.88]